MDDDCILVVVPYLFELYCIFKNKKNLHELKDNGFQEGDFRWSGLRAKIRKFVSSL